MFFFSYPLCHFLLGFSKKSNRFRVTGYPVAPLVMSVCMNKSDGLARITFPDFLCIVGNGQIKEKIN